MDTIVRAYVPFEAERGKPKNWDDHGSNIVLVLDTETTINKDQNLLFGTCKIYFKSRSFSTYLFYGDNLDGNSLEVLKDYAAKNNLEIMKREDFIKRIFIPYIKEGRALCVCFNMPFDISRLAIAYGYARKSFKGGFSFRFSAKNSFPQINIKSIDSKRAFYSITYPRFRKEQKFRYYRGRFLDLRTMAFALTGQSYSLENAAKDFGCKLRKTHPEGHGKVTAEYIEYNINDVDVTYELYTKLLERYSDFKLDLPPENLFSPASLAKGYLKKYGIKPFLEKNHDFPKEILGYVMATYYGGRTEVRIRKTPAKITYLDFTSMYPTMYILMGLDSFLKADRIEYRETTTDTINLLENLTISDFKNPASWKGLTTICEVVPESDVLPLRSNYDGGNVSTIGINNITSSDGTSLWYTLADVICSKLITGKNPKIKKAISFFPAGTQKGLNTISVTEGVSINPQENIIKKLIDARLEIKSKLKECRNDEEKIQLTTRQKALKTIVNAMSYGIFVEIDVEELDEKEKVEVYGLKKFETAVNKLERPGRMFNPIIATMLTSGARLVLGITESLIKDNSGYFAYCDTDSAMISPEHKGIVQSFFQGLNPYDSSTEIFKVESDDDGKLLENVNFFGISAKRYVLFDIENGRRIIRSFSSHGLGNLVGIDDKEIWEDVLDIAYADQTLDDIAIKYAKKYAVSELTVTKASIMKRFKNVKGIKPYNFIMVGRACRTDEISNEPVIPMHQFVDGKEYGFRKIPYEPFTDYKSGKLYTKNTQFYWTSMDKVIMDYWMHPESKFNGEEGILSRKNITISAESIKYIGKESNELEESEIIGVSDGNYTLYENLIEKAKSLSNSERLKAGISKSWFYELKKRKKPFQRYGRVVQYLQRMEQQVKEL